MPNLLTMKSFLDWALSNKIELAGTVFGLIYIWFSVRQSLNTWPAGIITSVLYCYVFFCTRLYAGMALQFYYVFISCYGWWSWKHGANNDGEGDMLRVSNSPIVLWLRLLILNTFLTALMYAILRKYTDSTVPFGDALTTSLSIIATWMLARKKLENWIIWIVADLISIGLYMYQALYFTVFLFLIYTLMAVIGYYEWQKEPVKVQC